MLSISIFVSADSSNGFSEDDLNIEGEYINTHYGILHSKFVLSENILSKNLFLDNKQIAENVNSFCVYREYVIYSSKNTIYSYDIAETSTKIVYSNVQLRDLVIHDNYLYGVNDKNGMSQLLIIDLSSNELIKTNYTNVNSFSISDNELDIEIKLEESRLKEIGSNILKVSATGAINDSQNVSNSEEALENMMSAADNDISLFSMDDRNAVPVLMATVTLSSIQPAMFVMDTLYVAQGTHGSTNYPNAMAFDFDGSLGGTPAANVYAPFDSKIIYKANDKAGNCHAVFIESNNIVQYANGETGYMTVMVMHDEDISDISVGESLKQGEIFYQEGNYGWSNGQHLHLECHKGKTGLYNTSALFNYRGDINPNDALYLYSNTNVQKKGGYTWRTWNGSILTPEEPETHTHSYTRGIEAVHPHREYMTCSCGEYYYTGNNAYYLAYEGAHLHREYYYCEIESCELHCTYTGNYGVSVEYEAVHPHREYYNCEIEGCELNGTYTGNYGSTTKYESAYPYKEYYVCPVSACSYHNTYTGNTAAPLNVCADVTGSKVTVTWDSVTNATNYDVYLIQSPWAWEDIKYSKSVSGTSHVFTNVANGDYAAFVIARPNKDSIQSEWVSFTVNIKIPETPIPKASATYILENKSLTIKWDAVEGAEEYRYFLAEYPEGYAYTTNTTNGFTPDTSITFSGLSSGRYNFFVRSCNSAGQSERSEWVSFDVYKDDYLPVKTVQYNGHIYGLYDYEMSWTFARDLCTNMGGHLVTVTSKEESDFIESLIDFGAKDNYWLGATSINNDNNEYEWITGEEFIFDNWYADEPSSSGERAEKEQFAQIRKSNSKKWNDVNNINKTNKGFILEIEPTTDCVSATAIFNGNQYLLIDTNITWTEAKAYCEYLGGHLVIQNSPEEKEFVNQFIQKGSRSWYYLGGIQENDKWYWIDGSKAEYIDWADNAKNWNGGHLMKYKDKEGCISLKNTYYPAQHIKNIGFVCEIELPHTESIVNKTGNVLTIEIAKYNIAEGCKIIAAGYSGSELVDSKTLLNNTETITTTLEGDIDQIKVMVWDSENKLKPLCEAEVIPKSEFITQ